MFFERLFRSEKSRKPVPPAPRSPRENASRLGIEALEDRTVPSTFVVQTLADSGPGSLRQAVLDANTNPGADLVRFAPSARDGTIVLTGGQLTITDGLIIDGPGAGRLAVSGNNTSRIFQIGGGVVVGIDDLTVVHGRAVGQGGGIFNAGTLTVTNMTVSNNRVDGVAGANLGTVVDAFGGGIFNAGSLTVRDSSFVHNQSVGADGTASNIGSSALGGAIMSGPTNPLAAVTVRRSTFVDNQAIGGAAGIGASRAGIGGAIMNAAGTCTVNQSAFHDNRAVGGLENGNSGGFGAGSGGAIGNVARAASVTLSVSQCLLTNNQAIGGAAAAGPTGQEGRGGAIANFIFGGLVPPVTVTATVHIDHSTLLGNQAVGGAGTSGGAGRGGAVVNLNGGVVTVSDSVIALNQAVGGAGNGGNGGNGQGGGIFNGVPSPVGTPSLELQGDLVVFNRAEGGIAGPGGVAGLGQGGGLYIAPGGFASSDLRSLLFANDASTSDDDVFGILT